MLTFDVLHSNVEGSNFLFVHFYHHILNRLMFWIQNTKYKYNKALILKSSMDGSNEEILVEENIHFSNHLVVDESSERIYWIDRERAVIESIKYNGKQRKVNNCS